MNDSGLTRAQELQLELIRLATVNAHVDAVVDDLLRERELWDAALITRGGQFDLMPLRGLPENYWHGDLLYVVSSGAADDRLEELARGWDPDDLRWLEENEVVMRTGHASSVGSPRVLRIWWD